MEDAKLHSVANRGGKHCGRSKSVGGYGVFFTGIVCRSPSQTVPDRGALTASRQSKWADPLERRCYQQRRF